MNICEINYIPKTRPVLTEGQISITYPNCIDSARIPSAPKPHPSCQGKPPSSCPGLGSWTFCSSLYQSQRAFCLKPQAHLQSTSDAHLLDLEPTSRLKGGLVVHFSKTLQSLRSPLLSCPEAHLPQAGWGARSSIPPLRGVGGTYPSCQEWPHLPGEIKP